MPLSRVPSARLTSWPVLGVSGAALGCGFSDTRITHSHRLAGLTFYHGRERFPPGSDVHGDHV